MSQISSGGLRLKEELEQKEFYPGSPSGADLHFPHYGYCTKLHSEPEVFKQQLIADSYELLIQFAGLYGWRLLLRAMQAM
jgi:hypothetical protein